MTRCDLSSPDATCPQCGFVSKVRNAIRQCRKPLPTTCGPGCQLRKTLSWFVRDDGKCGCTEFAAKMDAWGPTECLRRLEEIVEHLREAAATKGLPFLATAARMMVARAIEAARQELAHATTHGHGPHRPEAVEDPRLRGAD
jgi:hypothetical protein